MAMEKLIIEQLKQGNEDAFKYIYKQHYVLLCRFANQMLADAALAEEIVDDAIFYLWEHRSDIEIEYSIRAYLMRAVRNRCLNELNSLRRREELLVSSFFLPENMEFLDRVFVEDEHPLGYLLEQELESELIRNIILSSATDGKVPETTCSLCFFRKLKKNFILTTL